MNRTFSERHRSAFFSPLRGVIYFIMLSRNCQVFFSIFLYKKVKKKTAFLWRFTKTWETRANRRETFLPKTERTADPKAAAHPGKTSIFPFPLTQWLPCWACEPVEPWGVSQDHRFNRWFAQPLKGAIADLDPERDTESLLSHHTLPVIDSFSLVLR